MATLKDVAKASGLTVGTVSRVLNNRGYISDKTMGKGVSGNERPELSAERNSPCPVQAEK